LLVFIIVVYNIFANEYLLLLKYPKVGECGTVEAGDWTIFFPALCTYFAIFCFFLQFCICSLQFTYNRPPALMIPGFSGLPVLYLYFFRGFVLKLNMI